MGATWPDVALELVRLARDDIGRFIITCAGLAAAGGIALAIMVLSLKIVVLGPLTRFRIQFDEARGKGQKPKQEKLPL